VAAQHFALLRDCVKGRHDRHFEMLTSN